MTLQLIESCPHDISERDVAHQADGLCPLCLASEVDRLRKALEEIARFKTQAGIMARAALAS